MRAPRLDDNLKKAPISMGGAITIVSLMPDVWPVRLISTLVLQFIKGDIMSADLVQHVLESHDIDTIMHFAAQVHPRMSILLQIMYVKH